MTVRSLARLKARLSNTRHGNEAHDLRDLLQSAHSWAYQALPALKPPDTADADDIEFSDYANATDPTVSPAMAWANQGSATGVINNGGLILDTNGSATNSWRGLGVPAPTGDFTVDTAVAGRLKGNYHGAGIFLLWGTLATPTEPIEGVRYSFNSNVRITAHEINTSFVGVSDRHTSGAVGALVAQPYAYLRLIWDSTAETLESLHSTSGFKGTWFSLGTSTFAGRGDPDFVLTMVEKNGQEMIGAFKYLRFNWTPDFDPTT